MLYIFPYKPDTDNLAACSHPLLSYSADFPFDISRIFYLTNEEVIIQYRGDVPTASMMYRRDAICMDKFFMQGGLGDYAHELYAITKGKIYFSSRIMSVYFQNTL